MNDELTYKYKNMLSNYDIYALVKIGFEACLDICAKELVENAFESFHSRISIKWTIIDDNDTTPQPSLSSMYHRTGRANRDRLLCGTRQQRKRQYVGLELPYKPFRNGFSEIGDNHMNQIFLLPTNQNPLINSRNKKLADDHSSMSKSLAELEDQFNKGNIDFRQITKSDNHRLIEQYGEAIEQIRLRWNMNRTKFGELIGIPSIELALVENLVADKDLVELVIKKIKAQLNIDLAKILSASEIETDPRHDDDYCIDCTGDFDGDEDLDLPPSPSNIITSLN